MIDVRLTYANYLIEIAFLVTDLINYTLYSSDPITRVSLVVISKLSSNSSLIEILTILG